MCAHSCHQLARVVVELMHQALCFLAARELALHSLVYCVLPLSSQISHSLSHKRFDSLSV